MARPVSTVPTDSAAISACAMYQALVISSTDTSSRWPVAPSSATWPRDRVGSYRDAVSTEADSTASATGCPFSTATTTNTPAPGASGTQAISPETLSPDSDGAGARLRPWRGSTVHAVSTSPGGRAAQ